jgi:hypothetical protein
VISFDWASHPRDHGSISIVSMPLAHHSLLPLQYVVEIFSSTFMVFAVACFLAYFWSTYIVPETANVSLEEIDAVFKSSAGREDVLLKREACFTFLRVYIRSDLEMTI